MKELRFRPSVECTSHCQTFGTKSVSRRLGAGRRAINRLMTRKCPGQVYFSPGGRRSSTHRGKGARRSVSPRENAEWNYVKGDILLLARLPFRVRPGRLLFSLSPQERGLKVTNALTHACHRYSHWFFFPPRLPSPAFVPLSAVASRPARKSSFEEE